MNLEKLIKRHVIGPRHTFLAITLPDFETICQNELDTLSDTLTADKTIRGGVLFSGRLSDLYLANLHLHTAGRILMRLDTFKATNFRQLANRAKAHPWALYLPAGAIPNCKVTARHSRLYHSQAIAQRICQAITAYWQEMAITPGQEMGQTLYVRIENDKVTLSLDSSGTNLYRRGLKRHRAEAPLRETTAATILLQAGYRPDMPLVDPMCGAGTFSLEAALMSKGIAPGAQRDFAFMRWPSFKPRQWQHLKKVATQKTRSAPQPHIWASDIKHRACVSLKQCVEDNHLNDTVRVRQKDFFDLSIAELGTPAGLVVINPPYGRRLAPADKLKAFYRRLADKLCRDYAGWRVALLVPKGALSKHFTAPLECRPLVHGGLTLTLVTGQLKQHHT